eukprot:TRINITY_DN4250_c0_g2_i1.p1 TRINITY_DN4250_c0_g2~~TRINITY_DN4250_c0_g2_i1.p1  ORF type:complete len:153 (+),score=19.91 TRINITY_DN4250_c0_g2_i1:33-491(+)
MCIRDSLSTDSLVSRNNLRSKNYEVSGKLTEEYDKLWDGSGLRELADNGGRTYTCAITWDSPARDSGLLSITNHIDQRGFQRPCRKLDIGSYEFIESPCSGPPDPKDTSSAHRTKSTPRFSKPVVERSGAALGRQVNILAVLLIAAVVALRI